MTIAPSSPVRSAVAARRPILTARGLRKVREQADQRFELEIPEFELRPGQFVALVGDSGCGKSTLLDILALVLCPTSCAVFELSIPGGARTDLWRLWRRRDENGLAAIRRHCLGYVLQTGGLLPFLSIEDNIRLPTRLIGAPLGHEEIHRLAERIGIGSVLPCKPHQLSGGQRQRAAILRALAHRPPIVLADEPTAAVDKPRARAVVADLHALAQEQGAVVVMVTHDHQLIDCTADITYGFACTQVSARETRSVCRRLS